MDKLIAWMEKERFRIALFGCSISEYEYILSELKRIKSEEKNETNFHILTHR